MDITTRFYSVFIKEVENENGCLMEVAVVTMVIDRTFNHKESNGLSRSSK